MQEASHLNRIIQWNCHSIRAHKLSLQTLMQQYSVSMCVVSETWLKDTTPFQIPGYNFIRRNRDDGYGGVGILLKKNIVYDEVTLNLRGSRLETCAIKVNYRGSSLTIVSVYRTPNLRVTEQELRQLFSKLSQPALILGDFNAHHLNWGSPTTDTLGIHLMGIAEEENLVLMNDGSPTRVSRPNQSPSAVDVSFASPTIALDFNWQVLQDTLGSDHFPILLTSNNPSTPLIIYPAYRWKTRQADWTTYKETIDHILEDYQESDDIVRDYEVFCDCITRAACLTIPQHRPYVYCKRSPTPWWDKECQAALDDRREALRQYKQDASEANYLNLQRTQAKAKRLFKHKKRQGWQQYCNSLNSFISPGTLWQNIRRFRNSQNCSQFTATCSISIKEDVMRNMAPASVHTDYILRNAREENSHPLLRPFEMQELINALKKSNNTAPGPDNIHYPMILNMSSAGHEKLLKLMNRMWFQRVHPPTFKLIRLVLLLKHGKNPRLSSSYRSLSLLSCLYKTLERMVKHRLEWWVEHYKLLSPQQMGFRRGKGTIDTLVHLITDIQLGLSNNNYVAAVYTDISSAYDNVLIPVLEDKLRHLQLPESFIGNLIYLMHDRRLIMFHNGTTIGPRLTSQGLPQGSILAPLLFNIYTADLASIFSPEIQVLQYADDICIYTEAKTLEKCKEQLTDAMQSFTPWLDNHGLTISAGKSAVSIYTRHLRPSLDTLQLGTYNFPYKVVVPYLGLHIDHKLTWSPHIHHILRKCDIAINVLRAISGSWWGCDPKIALLLYRSLIRPLLDYGSGCFASASKTLLSKLDRCQYKALRICIGAMQSTPTNALLVETLEPPLYLRRQYLAGKYILKLFQYENSPILHKISKLTTLALTTRYWQKKRLPALVEEFTNLSGCRQMICTTDTHPFFNCSYETTIKNLDIRLETSFDNNENWNKVNLNCLLAEWPNARHIYTDGSKDLNKVGSAYIDVSSGNCGKFKLPPIASIYTAELTAILGALQYATALSDQFIVVLSDSRSALQSLQTAATTTSGKPSTILVHKIIDMVHQIETQDRQVSFVWVKAHVGIPGNELADKAARSATTEGQEIYTTIPVSDYTSLLRRRQLTAWKTDWKITSQQRGKHYATIHPDIPNVLWHHKRPYSRQFIRAIARMKFHHGCFPQHLHKIQVIHSPFCSCSTNAVADLNHIFFGCQHHFARTTYLLQKLLALGHQLPPLLTSILFKSDQLTYEELYKFLTDIGLQI